VRQSLYSLVYGLPPENRVLLASGSKVSLSPQLTDGLLGPPSLSFNGYRFSLCPEIKRPMHVADHSTTSSVEVMYV
jgi:hypothetical protein